MRHMILTMVLFFLASTSSAQEDLLACVDLALVGNPGAFTGTGRSASTEIELEADISAQDLVEDFGQQLEEQGWARDTGWAGEYSNGSSWRRSPTAELELAGLLDVVVLGNSGYRASFRISSLATE